MNKKNARQTKEPKNTKLTQQELSACKPVLDATWVVFIFAAIAVIMIPVGVICLVFGMQPVELTAQYDHMCAAGVNDAEREASLLQNQPNKLTCDVYLNVTAKMIPPIYIYYELEGVYQNHRRYVKSRNDLQLSGQDVTDKAALSACEPIAYFGQNTSQIINPCGLIAWSNFNDSYVLTKESAGESNPITVIDKGLALPADVNARFGSYDASYFNTELNQTNPVRGGGNFTNLLTGQEMKVNEDERFIIWMRNAALPKFRKLWGKIDIELNQGDVVKVKVYNRWNSYKFNGKKSIVLGTTNWLGSHNPFLGIAFLVTGGVSLFMAVAYLICYCCFPRKFGDPALLREFRDHQ